MTNTLQPLLDRLATEGWLAPEWRSAAEAVPREWFVPDTVWVWHEDVGYVPMRWADDPERWLEMARGLTDESVVTQVDDGSPLPDPVRRTPTSSVTMPTVVFDMLKHVDVAPGHAVLEIGTGSGWNAALLAHRLGAERVTTVEVDTWVAARARKALSDAGYGGITPITGDGEHGCPSGAPFDRILSTAQCQRVPWAWVDQSRPGGKIVTPWGNEYVSGLQPVASDVAGAIPALIDAGYVALAPVDV